MIGIATGWLARLAMGHSRDEIVSLTISIALALSTYRLAVLTDVSGPIAVVVAGLVLINGPPGGKQPAAWRKHLAGFWSMIDDLVNTLLFLLMGAEILTLDLTAFTRPAVLAAIPLAILARLISIAIPLAIWPMPPGEKSKMTITLTWVGLRGAVSIALVLTTPEGPYTSTFAAACYTVVIFTIIAQGLSTPLVLGLLYRSGIVPPARRGDCTAVATRCVGVPREGMTRRKARRTRTSPPAQCVFKPLCIPRSTCLRGKIVIPGTVDRAIRHLHRESEARCLAAPRSRSPHRARRRGQALEIPATLQLQD